MEQNNETQTPNPSPKSNMGLWIAIVILALAVLAGGYMLMKKKTSPDQTAGQEQNTKPAETDNALTAPQAPAEQPAQIPAQDQTLKATSSTPPVQAAPTTQEKTFTVEGGEFYFKPNTITVNKGDKVKIIFNNVEGFHDFLIDEIAGAKTKRIQGGQTDTIEFTVDKTGSFEYYCSVGSHRQMGMKGTLIVN